MVLKNLFILLLILILVTFYLSVTKKDLLTEWTNLSMTTVFVEQSGDTGSVKTVLWKARSLSTTKILIAPYKYLSPSMSESIAGFVMAYRSHLFIAFTVVSVKWKWKSSKPLIRHRFLERTFCRACKNMKMFIMRWWWGSQRLGQKNWDTSWTKYKGIWS